MKMEEMGLKGKMWTWANNRVGEGYVKERLDRFFGSPLWILKSTQAIVLHEKKQSSDEARFCFDARMLLIPKMMDTV